MSLNEIKNLISLVNEVDKENISIIAQSTKSFNSPNCKNSLKITFISPP